ADGDWLDAFSRGLAGLADHHGMALVGGDTTRGPLTVTVQALGRLDGPALCRSGARPGDRILVSGTLGDAALGLGLWQAGEVADADSRWLADRLHRPTPRVALGRAMAAVAHAGIDVSDGLLSDLGHVCRRSAVGAVVRAQLLPLSPPLLGCRDPAEARRLALTGGDDYELCLALPGESVDRALDIAAGLGVALTEVGRVVAGQGVTVLDELGEPLALGPGYRHFGP
ncbi:MAG: thiamine-phosphate kinase, partial [Candidatus Competibacterales bacterium]|nr:thiamine-phosphate kinase [Candidatus Competibacterales bacterium]